MSHHDNDVTERYNREVRRARRSNAIFVCSVITATLVVWVGLFMLAECLWRHHS